MKNEFNAMRTDLANQFAEAGAALLHHMGTAGALAAIPDTEPPQYVVAGTLDIIGKILPAACPFPLAAPASADSPSTAGAELHIGVSNNDQGVHINIMQRQADGTATVIYTARAPAGDSYGRARLAAPVAQSTAGAANIKRYSIDCDGLPFFDNDGPWVAYEDIAAPVAQSTTGAAEPADMLSTDWKSGYSEGFEAAKRLLAAPALNPSDAPTAPEVPLWDENGEPWNLAAEQVEYGRAQAASKEGGAA